MAADECPDAWREAYPDPGTDYRYIAGGAVLAPAGQLAALLGGAGSLAATWDDPGAMAGAAASERHVWSEAFLLGAADTPGSAAAGALLDSHCQLFDVVAGREGDVACVAGEARWHNTVTGTYPLVFRADADSQFWDGLLLPAFERGLEQEEAAGGAPEGAALRAVCAPEDAPGGGEEAAAEGEAQPEAAAEGEAAAGEEAAAEGTQADAEVSEAGGEQAPEAGDAQEVEAAAEEGPTAVGEEGQPDAAGAEATQPEEVAVEAGEEAAPLDAEPAAEVAADGGAEEAGGEQAAAEGEPEAAQGGGEATLAGAEGGEDVEQAVAEENTGDAAEEQPAK